MKGKIIFWGLVLITSLFVPSSALAAVHYVRPGSAGNGSNWTNALSKLPADLVRGDTYYLAGGTYSGYVFDDPENGKLTSVVKATKANAGQVAGWSDAYGSQPAIFTGALKFQTGRYRLDGVTGGGPSSWISGFGFKLIIGKSTDNGIEAAAGISNLDISHLEIVQTAATKAGQSPNAGFYLGDSAATNLRFAYLYIHGLSGLAFYFGQGSGITIEYSYLANLCGTARLDADQHCEHLVARGLDNLVVRYSILKDVYSSGALVTNAGGDDSPAENWEIYGNVFTNNEAVPIVNNGPKAKNWKIFNNTFAGKITEISLQTQIGSQVYNNIFDSAEHIYGLEQAVHDFNTYSNPPVLCHDPDQTQFTVGYAANENGINDGCQSGGIDAVIGVPAASFINPAANDFRLASALPGWKKSGKTISGAGTNVCRLSGVVCNAEHPFDKDAFGRTRGADGVWDRGAYEFGGEIVQPKKENCIVLTEQLTLGDGEGEGVKRNEIITLQKFLATQNLAETKTLVAGGFFGNITLAAVKAFQRSFLGASEVTGDVGPRTRDQIKTLSCQ